MNDTRPPTPDHEPLDHEPLDRASGDSPLAAKIGSEQGMLVVKWGVMAVAVAFLMVAIGYFVGVRTAERPHNAADVGFLQDMTDHHDQAVEIARLVKDRASDSTIRSMANEVVMFQRYELGQMATMLNDLGAEPLPSDPNRTTMAWMDMSTPLRTMNGMATPEQMDALEAATGEEVDLLFLELMIAHHQGGVHMGEAAAERGSDPVVREFARKLAKNQATEIREYEGVRNRLLQA